MSTSGGNLEYFPTLVLLPKKETGVLSFLTKFPHYDGRRTIIAIFDTGVDPGAKGLQTTSDGKPKVIQRFDCTGAGDIDTSAIVHAVDGKIKGLSGKTLKIPSAWTNPTGQFRIGIKNKFLFLNKSVLQRVKKFRQQNMWTPLHNATEAAAARDLQDFTQKHEDKKLSRFLEDQKENLENLVCIHQMLDKKYADPGVCYDFVLFHSGKCWCLVVDTSEVGDLASCTLLEEFGVNPRSYARFSDEDQTNYSFNVHENGDVLEIVTCSGDHGTHVASIAAAHFPGKPELNGVAPGAQIMSFTIGDNRLGSMETGTGLIRAMIQVMHSCERNKQIVHVINMSYGEMAATALSGRVGEIINVLIDRFGVIFVCSVGNQGPALFTVNTPPDISTTSVIGVGAFISPEMMQVEYSMSKSTSATCYTWSSRGPTRDGSRGVTVCAPGCAITSVPRSTLCYSALMNGTSMASPHVAGAVSILISGLLARDVPYTPYFVKRTLENTASFQEGVDAFVQGCGLLQVEKAFDYLLAYHEEKECDVRFHITCGSKDGMKGILMRVGPHMHKNFPVCVEPIFFQLEKCDADKKIDFQMSLGLVCHASWVEFPQYLEIMNTKRSFSVKVNAAALSPGVYTTSIRAYDVGNVSKGPVFQVPVTVLKCENLSPDGGVVRQGEFVYRNVTFGPSAVKRHFIMVPEECSWGEININPVTKVESQSRFVIHCVQFSPRLKFQAYEYYKMFSVYDKPDTVLAFKVKAGVMMELTVAKYWTDIGEDCLNYSVAFKGIPFKNGEVVMHHATGLHRLELRPGLESQMVKVHACLQHSVTILKPVESVILPLNDETRDVLLPLKSHIYQLLLTYNVSVLKATKVMFSCPTLGEHLYDSEFESQLWMLFDSNKRLVACGDAFPTKYVLKKLEKGDYVLRQQVRHDKKDMLDKLTEKPMLISQKLPAVLEVDAFESHTDFFSGNKFTGKNLLVTSHEFPLYLAPVSNDKLANVCKTLYPGQYLTGTISFSKGEEKVSKINCYPFKYIMAEMQKRAPKDNKCVPEKTKLEEYEEAYQDFVPTWISKLDSGCPKAEELYADLARAYPNFLPAHAAMMKNLMPEKDAFFPWSSNPPHSKDVLHRVIQLADEILKVVNPEEILAYQATKNDLTEDATKIKIEMEKRKSVLMDAICYKGISLCQLNGFEGEEQADECALAPIEELWALLVKFVDMTDGKVGKRGACIRENHSGTTTLTSQSLADFTVWFFALWRAAIYNHLGTAAKILLKVSEEKASKEVDECLLYIFEQLHWQHCCHLYKNKLLNNYPEKYVPF